MRVAVLWSRLSGYFNACLKELAALPGVELYLAHIGEARDAPFDAAQFQWLGRARVFSGDPDAAALCRDLDAFAPDALLINSWHFGAYRRIARAYAGRAARVLAADNQWLGTVRQRLGVAVAPWYIAPLYDAAFVPGERQAVFARLLGFPEERIWRGLYSCDHDAFAAAYRLRRERTGPPPRDFLFVGRLVPEKGIDVLLDAYARYRAGTEAGAGPLPLRLCGAGPLEAACRDRPGVRLEGFVQPDRLPAAMADAGCLLLPSRFEPWGVVVHEAAAAGLALICSERCGASVHLLQDGYNGFLAAAGRAAPLARALAAYAALDDDGVRAMAEASHGLSLQFTPRRWARGFHDRLVALIPAVRRGAV